jgi:Predicted hydrolase of the metallo-beta-lactamase superfamily
MHFKIHRGTQEIGGSCVEVWTDTTRIVLDIGMPLVEKDGAEFDFSKFKLLTVNELISKKILPDIKGFYTHANKLIDGVLISHPHIDHYGFSHFLHSDIHYYLGKATHKLIELTGIFTPQRNVLKNYIYFEKSKPFMIGDMRITPFWMDHSGFDAYAFFIEAEGKALFYSGDFRRHGRKKAFEWFKHNAPANIDYLLMEGTQIERNTQRDKTETEVENELSNIFSNGDKINLIYTSGQNIDRLVSIYRACKRTGKTFVVDVYIATVLKELARFASLPFPSENFKDVKVIFSHFLCKQLTKEHNEKLLYQFSHHKITKEEISENQKDIVMAVRPSMKFDLEHIQNLDGGTLIYSLWEGYLKKENTKKFIDYLKNKKFKVFKIHTSGHADIATLKEMANIIKPKCIIPIHTFRGNLYKRYFDYPVWEVKDGEEVSI